MTTGIRTETEIRQRVRNHAPSVVVGVNKRVQTNTPGLYVTLRSVRIFATDLYAVAVVDSTGRLQNPSTLRLIPDLTTARRAANRLLQRQGGPAELRNTATPYLPAADIPPNANTNTTKDH
jgi:hypothetical protein